MGGLLGWGGKDYVGPPLKLLGGGGAFAYVNIVSKVLLILQINQLISI